MGVSLLAFRCAHASKVGVLRAALSLRCFALLTHPPHASRNYAASMLILLIQILSL
ncbi:MAG: hypothetical protein NZ455_10780 [Bacteroidia bacterium]|nr:hypothetical protein [Bacteroidia bacterium]MDW8347597.1 hypothetical protein [Bacteroidia bacterium]